MLSKKKKKKKNQFRSKSSTIMKFVIKGREMRKFDEKQNEWYK